MSAGAQHLHVRQDNEIALPVRMQGAALLTSMDASSNRLLSPEDAVARRKALPALARLDLRANPAAAHPRYRRVSALDAAPAHTDTDFCKQLPHGHASVHPLSLALWHCRVTQMLHIKGNWDVLQELVAAAAALPGMAGRQAPPACSPANRKQRAAACQPSARLLLHRPAELLAGHPWCVWRLTLPLCNRARHAHCSCSAPLILMRNRHTPL